MLNLKQIECMYVYSSHSLSEKKYLVLIWTPIINKLYLSIMRVAIGNDIIHVLFCFFFGFEVVSLQTVLILLEMLRNMFKDPFVKALVWWIHKFGLYFIDRTKIENKWNVEEYISLTYRKWNVRLWEITVYNRD